MRFFAEFILSHDSRVFASLRVTVSEGLRMTGREGLRMTRCMRLPRLRAITPAYRRQALRRAGTSSQEFGTLRNDNILIILKGRRDNGKE
jgi:hypothetical protein